MLCVSQRYDLLQCTGTVVVPKHVFTAKPQLPNIKSLLQGNSCFMSLRLQPSPVLLHLNIANVSQIIYSYIVM